MMGRLEYGTQVTSAGDSPGPDQVDPAFEGLFRPEDLAGAPAAMGPPATSLDESEPVHVPEPAFAAASEPAADQPPAAASAPSADAAERQPLTDTGRLFRSQGVADRPDTVLALETGRFSRLRTLERTQTGADPDPSNAAVAALLVDSATDASTGGAMPSAESPSEPGRRPGRKERRARSRATSAPRASGRGASGVVISLVVIIVTVAVGFADAILGDGTLGWPTGVALLLASLYGAFAVRRDSDTIAFLIPPIAFLIATLTAGQLFLDSGEGSLVNRAVIVFFTLADNWIWILGSTLAALIVVLVRRRRR